MLNLKNNSNGNNILDTIDSNILYDISNRTNMSMDKVEEIVKPYLYNGLYLNQSVINSIYDDILDNVRNIFIQSKSMDKNMPYKDVLIVLEDITYRMKNKSRYFINYMETIGFDYFENCFFKILNNEIEAEILYTLEDKVEEYIKNNPEELSYSSLLKLLVETTEALNLVSVQKSENLNISI